MIEVEAEDAEDAEARVHQLVAEDEIPEALWQLQPFDLPSNYTAHAERVISAHDVEDYAVDVDELRSAWQPWFDAQQPQLLEYDIATDWLAEIDKMRGRYV